MADKIINTDTMIGKVISIMIALLFVVILAFPVANSLSNMGKDDGGSGGEIPTTLTNTGQSYMLSDSGEHTINISIEGNKFLLTVDGESVDVGFDYVERNWETDYSHVSRILLTQGNNTDGAMGEETDSVWLDQFGKITYNGLGLRSLYWGEVELTFVDNVMFVTDEYDGDWYIDVQYCISASGDYVMAENPNVFANTEILVEYMAEDSVYTTIVSPSGTDQYSALFIAHGSGNLNTVIDSLDWKLLPWLEQTFDSLPLNYLDYTTYELDLTPMNGYYVLNGINIIVDAQNVPGEDGYTWTGEYPITKFLVPKTTTYDPSVTYGNEESGSGSDSESGSDGLGDVASTLIKLVPLLLIVSIILVLIIPMIQNRMQ